MDYMAELINYIEVHSVQGIRNCFDKGIDVNAMFRGKPLIDELTSEYARTPRFKDCVKAFVDYGLQFNNNALLAVLLDDAILLENELKQDATIVTKKNTLRCAYTPLFEVTLLHICAEFNHLSCAEKLVKYGADINAVAGLDQYGFGGQTPVFHTVNQNADNSADMLQFLLSHDADLTITVRGLTWGKGYEWETLVPAINPISYAMMGLLPQMHRDEKTIARTISLLLKHRYGIAVTPVNIPNRYLSK